MGLILWIDQNTFASSLVEKVFKKKDLPFYTIAKVDDFAYLVDDLTPEIIVLDTQTALANLDAFRNQYEVSDALQRTPFILMGDGSQFNFIQKIIGEIKRPFEPFDLPQRISSILGKLN